MNYKHLFDVLNAGLPYSISHYDIVANQILVMHMTKHGQFKPEIYKQEVQGFIDYTKEHLPSINDRAPLNNTKPYYEHVKLVLGLQIKAVDAAEVVSIKTGYDLSGVTVKDLTTDDIKKLLKK